jgi:hypothetical protein
MQDNKMSAENENGSPAGAAPEAPANAEHLNIKVSDNNNEVFFKIKRTTKLEKLMTAFCERQGKSLSSVRFLFEGTRVQPTDTPEAVRFHTPPIQMKKRIATVVAHPSPSGLSVVTVVATSRTRPFSPI